MTQAHAATQQVTDPHYSIVLQGDWAARPGVDSEQQTYYSKMLDTTVVMSSIDINERPDALKSIAEMMVKLRLKGESRAALAYGVGMMIAEPIIVPRPWGYAIAYYGSDTNDRHFDYTGIIIKSAVINVYVESPTASGKALAATLNRLIDDLKFDRN